MVALVFRIIVNKKKSVTYCQQVLFIVKVFYVHKVFIALFVEYPLWFLLCHNLRLHMLKTCSIGKTVLSVSCARFKSHICKLRPPPHFKTKTQYSEWTVGPLSSVTCPPTQFTAYAVYWLPTASSGFLLARKCN